MILFKHVGDNIEITKSNGDIVTVPNSAKVKENCCTTSVYLHFADSADNIQINYSEEISIDGGEPITGVDDIGSALSEIFTTPATTVLTYTDVQITDAQLKDLLNTPVEVLPAPANGKGYYFPVGAYALLDSVAGAYTVPEGESTELKYSFGSTPTNAVPMGDSSKWEQAALSTDINGLAFLTTNEAVYLTNQGTADYTGGNAGNTLSLRIYYLLVDTNPFGG